MRFKLLGILGIIFLFFDQSVKAQTVTISDSETGQPVELATLISNEPSAFVITNAKGQADISQFEGSDFIEIRSLSYETVSFSYTEIVSAGYKIKLKPSNILLDDVVVSATRWNQVSRDVPSEVISISPKEIALQNPQNAADMLNVSGKVYIQKSQQGGGSPMIRGFATNRLLYVVDGVRMNTAIFRGGNIQNVISLDPFAIEHTEVLFGPGSVIYGSDAIGGVMSFQTLKPQMALNGKTLISGRALSRFSSANQEATGHLNINVGWKTFSFVSSMSVTNFGDLKMGSFGPEKYLRPYYVDRIADGDVVVQNDNSRIQRPSAYSQFNLMQKIRYKPSSTWDLDYGFHYSETSEYGRYDRHLLTKDATPRYGEWSYGPQVWMMNNLSLAYSEENVLFDHSSLRLAHQYFEESRISRNFNETSRDNRIEKVNAFSFNLDMNKSTSLKNKFFYGMELVWNKVDSDAFSEDIISLNVNPAASRYPESNWSSYGIYITDHFTFNERFILQAGLRYNLMNMTSRFDTVYYPIPFTTSYLTNDALTGSLGMVYKTKFDWTLKFNISTAFRAPNVDDSGKVFDSEPGAVVVPNPDLQAEYAYNADIGITKIFNKQIKIDLSGYYTLLNNAMVRRDFQLNGLDSIMYDGSMSKVQAIQNAAIARVYGLQAGIELKLPAGFSLASNINYQKGIEELDDGTISPSRHAAPLFGTTSLSFRDKNLNIKLYTVYNGEKSFDQLPETEKTKDYLYALDEQGNPYSPAWFTLNLKASFQLKNGFHINAGVENILDKRYLPYSSGIAAPGRNFILSLKYAF